MISGIEKKKQIKETFASTCKEAKARTDKDTLTNPSPCFVKTSSTWLASLKICLQDECLSNQINEVGTFVRR